jgi:O-antigen ligase
MEFTSSVVIQLTVALLVATIVFFGAYSMPRKMAAIILLVFIPFQPVDTNYFTANVLMTYSIFIAMLLRRGSVRLPMLPQFLIVIFCFFLAYSQVHPTTYLQHAVYIFALISAFLVFWITYDVGMRFDNVRSLVLVFVVMNVAVIIYCFIQISLGPGTKVVLFGIDEMSMMPMRRDNRLTGPFGAVGITAEYFVIMIYLQLYELISGVSKRYRNVLLLLIIVNLFLLLTTANRGGFLIFLTSSALFLWMFRKEVGLRRIVGIVTGGALAITASAIIAINYTEFGGLFERLGDTQFDEGIPDTRQAVWPFVWNEVKRKPFLGHGPRLRFPGGDTGTRYEGHQFVRYPHNLYLFMLFTIGIVGLLGFVAMLATPLIRCWKIAVRPHDDPYLHGLAKTGVVLMLIIFADQMKVSFMRLALVDYWHFLFALFGLLLAACDRAQLSAARPVKTY